MKQKPENPRNQHHRPDLLTGGRLHEADPFFVRVVAAGEEVRNKPNERQSNGSANGLDDEHLARVRG